MLRAINEIREERRLRVIENMILSEVFGPKVKRIGSGEGVTMKKFTVCTVYLIGSG